MENPEKSPGEKPESGDRPESKKKRFTLKRIVVGSAVAVAVIWIGWFLLAYFFEKPMGKSAKTATSHTTAKVAADHYASKTVAGDRSETGPIHAPAADRKTTESSRAHGSPADIRTTGKGHTTQVERPGPPRAKGVAFVEAVIQPLSYELNDRFYGWRPNDILDFTDNVNNIQLGVLEVTRRTVVELAERISRTGSTASFDPHLEKAMNYLMVKADEYWFPSAESKYKDSIKELGIYKERLERGEANFFTRADNLIPLLAAFEDLLGSCDENLVKSEEDDGEPVSHFKADDYFYYAKGVATTMYPILEAVMVDFQGTLENRNGVDVLHHAIESLKRAMDIEPWYITEADLDGILANHRANMAAPISHARFYIGVLINTLST